MSLEDMLTERERNVLLARQAASNTASVKSALTEDEFEREAATGYVLTTFTRAAEILVISKSKMAEQLVKSWTRQNVVYHEGQGRLVRVYVDSRMVEIVDGDDTKVVKRYTV